MANEFGRFELFLRRETTRLLEERLNEFLLDGNSMLDPTGLAGQLSNIVNQILSEAIRSYRNTLQGSDGPQTSQSGDEEGSHLNCDPPPPPPLRCHHTM